MAIVYKANQDGFKEVLPGIKLKTLVYGKRSFYRIQNGCRCGAA